MNNLGTFYFDFFVQLAILIFPAIGAIIHTESEVIEMAKERNLIIAVSCPFCGADHEVEVNFEEYLVWQGGECIQYAMPNHSATEREQLLTGMCPQCQIKFFGE